MSSLEQKQAVNDLKSRVTAEQLAYWLEQELGEKVSRTGKDWRVGKGKDGSIVISDTPNGPVVDEKNCGNPKVKPGDVFTVIQSVTGAEFPAAMQIARDIAGIPTEPKKQPPTRTKEDVKKDYDSFIEKEWDKLVEGLSSPECAKLMRARGLDEWKIQAAPNVGYAKESKLLYTLPDDKKGYIKSNSLVFRDGKQIKAIPFKPDGHRLKTALQIPGGGNCYWMPFEKLPESGPVILCEGELDAFALYSCANIAAIPCKPEAAGKDIIKSLAGRCILGYDNDEAGAGETEKARIIIPNAIDISDLWPKGGDPNDYVENGRKNYDPIHDLIMEHIETKEAKQAKHAARQEQAEQAEQLAQKKKRQTEKEYTETPTADDNSTTRRALFRLRKPNKDELNTEIARFISDFYNVFLLYDDGLCERATGYLYKGADFNRIMKRTVIQCAPEGKGRPCAYTVAQALALDTNDRRRVELREVRSYKTADAVNLEFKELQCGERAPLATVNHLPRIAPHDGQYGEAEKTALHAALMQFANCFDTPKEFVWALNCVCHKAVYGVAQRAKCILFLFDDGIEGDGAGRGKTLFSRLARFMYGREHVSTTRKKYGYRAEKDFDGLENLMLFNVCDEFRPLNQKNYMDELCAYVDGDEFDYTEKGKQTIKVETVCQLILTANTASEMELTNRTRRRVAFMRFNKPWDGDTDGARVVYQMCGERGDEWRRDNDPDAVRLRSCLWAFCHKALNDEGPLHAPVMMDVDKALGHTAGQDLARAQKAAENELYQRILDDLTRAAESETQEQENESFGTFVEHLETTARAIANRLHVTAQAVSRAIHDVNNGEIDKDETWDGRNKVSRYKLARTPYASTKEKEIDAPTKWNYPKTFEAVEKAILDTLTKI